MGRWRNDEEEVVVDMEVEVEAGKEEEEGRARGNRGKGVEGRDIKGLEQVAVILLRGGLWWMHLWQGEWVCC